MTPFDLNLHFILQAGNFGKCILEYFRVIDSINFKLDRLISAELNTAYEYLKSAESATNFDMQQHLIHDSRRSFTRATNLEIDNLRLAMSYLGLAFCYYHLDEKLNCDIQLEKIIDVKNYNFFTSLNNKIESDYLVGLKLGVKRYFLYERGDTRFANACTYAYCYSKRS